MVFNPIYEMDTLRRLVDEVFSPSIFEGRLDNFARANVYESDKGFVVQMYAPGVKNDDIDLNFSNGILTIKTKRTKDTSKFKDAKVLREETVDFDYSRSFTVPADIDTEKITAKFEHGMLIVHLPKSEKSMPKKIEVKVK